MSNKLNRKIIVAAFSVSIFGFSSCKKLIEVDPPATSVTAANVYSENSMAASVLTGMYIRMQSSFSKGDITSISVYPELAADNLTQFDVSNSTYRKYYQNDVTPELTSTYWDNLFYYIYTSTAAIEGLTASNSLDPAVKKRALGEAYFIRAFNYFYLVNLYGDLPLVLTTDYKKTYSLSRSPVSVIYDQIVADLKNAKQNLDEQYVDATLKASTTERVRPNLNAARALLARVYLYRKEYSLAETEASSVISQTSSFSLAGLNNVFVKNSSETIWALQPVRTNPSNTDEGNLFIPAAAGFGPSTPLTASSNLVNSFESGDLRKTNWFGSLVQGGSTLYYPFKYKIKTSTTAATEYTMVLRLAELYLIRAEARAELNNISGAQADLNVIRTRAGLANTVAATQADLRIAVLKERRSELFTEWGHRWLDLKRTGNIDAVMNIVAPTKGTTWAPYKALFSIPVTDILTAPNITQNPGY